MDVSPHHLPQRLIHQLMTPDQSLSFKCFAYNCRIKMTSATLLDTSMTSMALTVIINVQLDCGCIADEVGFNYDDDVNNDDDDDDFYVSLRGLFSFIQIDSFSENEFRRYSYTSPSKYHRHNPMRIHLPCSLFILLPSQRDIINNILWPLTWRHHGCFYNFFSLLIMLVCY